MSIVTRINEIVIGQKISKTFQTNSLALPPSRKRIPKMIIMNELIYINTFPSSIRSFLDQIR